MGTPLDHERYISLRTFRKDESGVDTPVWCAPLDGRLVVFTLGDSYKVRRLRRNPRAQVARCDARGKVLGPWYDAKCVIVDDRDKERRAYQALTAKYGWMMRVGNFFSRLAGRLEKRKILEITVEATDEAPT